MNNLCTDIGFMSLNKHGEQLCGDHVDIVPQGENSTVVVLADGMGSGVKANILSTLTSKIISTMMAEGMQVEDCVETIASTLPICSVRGVAYSTFTIIRIIENEEAELIQYDNPFVVMLRNGKNLEYPREEVEVGGNTLRLTGKVQTTAVVTDYSITLSFALILPDEAFQYYTQGQYDVYVNGVLDSSVSEKTGLMQAISGMNEKLNETGLNYESYLQNMGRQLFYIVAASYITIYLAIIFLIVANTVIGVQFLMNQQKTNRRYKTLIKLGAVYETLCASAKKQINWYFGIPVLAAAVSSLFAVRALFTGLLSSVTRGSAGEMMFISAAMILMLCVIEYIYMAAVKRSSSRYLLTLMAPEREE